jgi:hypothetical protein
MSDAASAATLTGGISAWFVGGWTGNLSARQTFIRPAAAASPYRDERANIAATKALRNRKLNPYRGRGSKLTSARFHHKFRLHQATRLSSPNVLRRDGPGQFISDREINAGSAFQFDSNLTLIEVVLVIAT